MHCFGTGERADDVKEIHHHGSTPGIEVVQRHLLRCEYCPKLVPPTFMHNHVITEHLDRLDGRTIAKYLPPPQRPGYAKTMRSVRRVAKPWFVDKRRTTLP